MDYIGHDEIRTRIDADGLPAVSLFIGPHSVGKRKLAELYANSETDDPRDILRVHLLTANLANEINRFLRTAPAGTKNRFLIVQLDGASNTALNSLLIGLEDVPTFTRVIMLAVVPPPANVRSRAVEFVFPALTEEEVALVLEGRRFHTGEAESRAKGAGGQVKVALDKTNRAAIKPLVLSVVRCIRDRDVRTLETTASRWTDDHTELLTLCAYESVTGIWRLFNADEVGAIPKKLWLAILRAIRPKVRPRLVIHAQIATVLRETR